MKKKILFAAGGVLIVLVAVFALVLTQKRGVEAQTAPGIFDVTLAKTLLTMPGFGNFVGDDAGLVGTHWLSGGYFTVSSMCNANNNKRGLWVFTEAGSQAGARDACLDIGEDPNDSVDHSWDVSGNIQPTGPNSFVKEMSPAKYRPPVYYTVSGSQVNYVSQAYPAPAAGSQVGSTVGTHWESDVAATPGYAVVWRNNQRDVLYKVPEWIVVQDMPAAFIPLTGVGNYILGVPVADRGSLVLYRVAGNTLEEAGRLPSVRPFAIAVDAADSSKVGFLIRDSLSGNYHIDVYSVSGSGFSLVKSVSVPSSVKFINPSVNGDSAQSSPTLALSGDYAAFVDCGLSLLPFPPNGARDFFNTASCGLAVMKGGNLLNVQRLPYATTIGSASTPPAQTLPPEISGIAMSPNGTIVATSLYGAYMYKISGVTPPVPGTSVDEHLFGGPGTPATPPPTSSGPPLSFGQYTLDTLKQLLYNLQTLLGLKTSGGPGTSSSGPLTPPPPGSGTSTPPPFSQGTGPCASGALKGNSPGIQTVAGEATLNLVRMAMNCPTTWVLKQPLASYMTSGSPNQKLVSRTWYYGWAMKAGTAAQKAEAKTLMLDAFDQQEKHGHYVIGANEVFPISHYEVWYIGAAGARFLARFYNDPQLLAATGRWWREEMALNKLLVRNNKILTPGTRFSAGVPTDSNLRDAIYAMLAGTDLPSNPGANGKPPGGAGIPNSPWWNDYFNSGAWIVRNLLQTGDDLGGAARATNADLPILHDPLCVYTKGSDYVFNFPNMTDAGDIIYWTARINGVETQGPYIKGSLPAGAPARTPPPALPGAALFTVPGPNGNVSGCTAQ